MSQQQHQKQKGEVENEIKFNYIKSNIRSVCVDRFETMRWGLFTSMTLMAIDNLIKFTIGNGMRLNLVKERRDRILDESSFVQSSSKVSAC